MLFYILIYCKIIESRKKHVGGMRKKQTIIIEYLSLSINKTMFYYDFDQNFDGGPRVLRPTTSRKMIAEKRNGYPGVADDKEIRNSRVRHELRISISQESNMK